MHAVQDGIRGKLDERSKTLRVAQVADNESCSTKVELLHNSSPLRRVRADVGGLRCFQLNYRRMEVVSSCLVIAAVLHWKVGPGLCSAA
jgi:hypothetical protein